MSVVVVNATGNQDIDGILWGWRWGQTNLTFSFPTSSSEYTGYAQVNGFGSFSGYQANAARQALNLIASYTNLTFTETTSAGAQLRFAKASSIDYTDDATVSQNHGLNTINTAQGNPPSLADGSTPPSTPGYAQGDTWFNPSGYNSPQIGSFQDAAGVMHEIGHDMGLKHGHVTQVGHGVTFPTLPANHDSYEYSVMTYQQFPDDSASNGDSAPDHPTSYMQDDIAAMQYMYGANYNTNSGNTTYTWSNTTGQEFINGVGQTNFNGEAAPSDGEIFQTVWDGGGVDTYDFSNFTTNMNVDLSPGGWIVLDTSASHRQRADLGFDTVTNSEYYARGNIANAQLDPNNANETASLIENAYGGSGDDVLAGNAANNVLKGGGGNDTLAGGDGDDTLYGGAPLSTNDGDDTLKGGGGNDYLYGGSGDDTLKGGGGADHLDGGTGVNTADYTQSAAGVYVNLVAGTGSGGDAQGDTLVNIQILQGSAEGDTLVGDSQVNSLYGNAGDDFIYAGAAGSTLDGGAGTADMLSFFYMTSGVTVDLSGTVAPGGAAAGDIISNFEQLDGSNYADTLYGDSGANFIYGEGGDDVINAGDGADYVYAGDGDDRVVDTDYVNFDSYNGGSGVNTIDYSGVTFGGAGLVTIDLATGMVSVNTSSGNTEAIVNFQNVEGSQGGETIIGSDANNILDGNGGDDVIMGGGGNDTLSGGTGADSLDGGSGVNTASYQTSAAAVNVNLNTGVGTGGDAQGDTLVNIQNLIGSAYGDTLTGDSANNVFNGLGGADTMIGLGGDDTYLVNSPGDVVQEAVGGGVDRVLTSVSYTLTAGQEIEYLTTTNSRGTGAINLTGNAFGQTIIGNAGANVINGGAGADTMQGLGGNDAYFVDNAGDKVLEAAGGGTDRVYTSVSYTLTVGQEIEVFSTTNAAGTGALNLVGNAFGQTIIGNAGANIINGGGGADTMQGLGGNDTYIVDNAGDKVLEAAGGGTDRVDTSVNYTLTAGQEIEVFSTTNAAGTGAVNLTGNAYGQTIIGNAGANVIDGGAGNDVLQGLGGSDTFKFDTALNATTNVDRITDFSTAADTISLAHSIFSTLATGTLAAADFFIGTAAQNANEHVLYNSANGWLSYDSDGNGAAAATHFATLSTALALKNTNFTVS